MNIPAQVLKDYIIAIGASTGGVEATTRLLRALPVTLPGIVIVQHMPRDFTAMYADSLNRELDFDVKEAADGQSVGPGSIRIGRAGSQLAVERRGGGFITRLGGAEKYSGHCPSADVLFESVAKAAEAKAVGVILTGM
jgi:two-component system chemotaxis response regulator CheB